MDRKVWSDEERLSVVLALLKGEQTAVEICRQYQVSTTQVYRHEYRDLVEGKMGWGLYRSWYNNEMVHQTLNYRTPRQARTGQMMALAYEVKMCNINQTPLCPK